MKKNFLLIEHGGLRKKFTLEKLQEKGLNIFLATTDLPLWLKGLIPKINVIKTDTYHSTKLLSDVITFSEARNIKFDALGTFYEHTVTQVADLASALKLIGLNPGAARRSSSNKLLMRRTCRDNSIPTPKLTVISNYDKKQLLQAVKKIGTPCVIKPIFGAESYGTIKIEDGFNIDDILDEIKLTTAQDQKETFKNFTGNFLVEEYLPGKVVSVDGIVQNLKIFIAGMVEFIMGPEPRFAQEANFIPPTGLSGKEINDCILMAKRIIKALEFDNCGFHCELRLTPNGPVLLEIAARLPGGPLQPGYLNAYGIDLTSLLIDVWLGKKIKVDRSKKLYIMQKAFFPRKSGKLTQLRGINSLKKDPGVWEFAKIAKIGDEIKEHGTPLYYYAIKDLSKRSLLEKSKKIEENIQFLIE